MTLTLVIGNKNYSSWSLRAWLYMRHSDLVFEEKRIVLDVDGFKQRILEHSPAGCVPVLHDGDLRIWDSIAIMDHLRERFPEQAAGWPDEDDARALARSVSAEMHSGFANVRTELPQDIRARTPRTLSSACRAEIDRVFQIWSECRSRFGKQGPWLFGRFSIPDAMFAPVALRFVTYGIDVPQPAAEFVDAVTSDPATREWIAASNEETEHIPSID